MPDAGKAGCRGEKLKKGPAHGVEDWVRAAHRDLEEKSSRPPTPGTDKEMEMVTNST